MLDASIGAVYFMRLGLGEAQGRILGACRINGFEAVALIDVHGFNHGQPLRKAELPLATEGIRAILHRMGVVTHNLHSYARISSNS